MESGKYSLWVSGKQLNWNTLTEAIIVWTLNLLSGKDSLNMSHIFWIFYERETRNLMCLEIMSKSRVVIYVDYI